MSLLRVELGLPTSANYSCSPNQVGGYGEPIFMQPRPLAVDTVRLICWQTEDMQQEAIDVGMFARSTTRDPARPIAPQSRH